MCESKDKLATSVYHANVCWKRDCQSFSLWRFLRKMLEKCHKVHFCTRSPIVWEQGSHIFCLLDTGSFPAISRTWTRIAKEKQTILRIFARIARICTELQIWGEEATSACVPSLEHVVVETPLSHLNSKANWTLRFLYGFLSFPERVPELEGGVQVSRRVGVVFTEDVLEPAAVVPRDGRPPQGPLRRRVARGLQPPRHQTGAEQLALQQTHQGGPHIPRSVPRLLWPEPGHRVARHQGPKVQPRLAGHGRVQPHVLWAGLQHVQSHGDGEVSL